jgi:hypothetical protein
MDFQVILYHKQATSARTRFVKFSGDTVFAYGPVNALSQIDERDDNNTLIHPTAALRKTELQIGMPAQSLDAVPEFQYSIEVPGGNIRVLLAAINTIDPPFEEIERAGGSFIDLTQARGLPQIELELLRHAYELVLGG